MRKETEFKWLAVAGVLLVPLALTIGWLSWHFYSENFYIRMFSIVPAFVLGFLTGMVLGCLQRAIQLTKRDDQNKHIKTLVEAEEE